MTRRCRAIDPASDPDRDLDPQPAWLFHGTVGRSLPAIRDGGLARMARHHVHLSPDRETAAGVGQRRGKPIVLVIAAGRMAREGHEFFVSANGVWLIDHVPPEFIEIPEEPGS